MVLCLKLGTWGSSGALIPCQDSEQPRAVRASPFRCSEVIGNPRTSRRGLLFPALSYLCFEIYQVISQAAVVHATTQIEDILEQADYLYESGETEKLYQLLTQYKESEESQLSRTSEEEKQLFIYEDLEYAKRALEKDESSFAAHKWYAICISDVGDYEGIKVKIANVYIIKEHFEKAIELNPKDATSIHLMGIWCYTFAEMPWYQRRIAKMLFATPPSSTYEEALGYSHRAEQMYLKLNNKKLAALWLMKAKNYPAHTEQDKTQVRRWRWSGFFLNLDSQDH
uniref:Regulator of microtubule dynamics protein 1 n=1 Tax=Cavia porcellus TaxID=10141 RepID=H0VXS2_CAVPO